jgi:hypothetical protein
MRCATLLAVSSIDSHDPFPMLPTNGLQGRDRIRASTNAANIATKHEFEVVSRDDPIVDQLRNRGLIV